MKKLKIALVAVVVSQPFWVSGFPRQNEKAHNSIEPGSKVIITKEAEAHFKQRARVILMEMADRGEIGLAPRMQPIQLVVAPGEYLYHYVIIPGTKTFDPYQGKPEKDSKDGN